MAWQKFPPDPKENMSEQTPMSVADMLAAGMTPNSTTKTQDKKAKNAVPGVVNLPSESELGKAFLGNIENNSDPMQQFFQLMIMREKRELLKAQSEENARLTREAQRDKNRSSDGAKILLKQARCSHLKGQGSTANNPTVDYAVYQHTFVNADTVIRCRYCAMKWRPEDTVEFLVRKGKKIANHTKIGWREAKLMVKQSTDKPSTSEIPFSALYQAQVEGRFVGPVNPLGIQQDIRTVDVDGNAVSDVEL
jgi:hypothetical protein